MARRTSLGICEACGARKAKGAMIGHLKSCLPSRPDSNRAPSSPVALVRVQASGTPTFWLDAAIKPEAKLKGLDRLLRRVWLECCGHLSEFYTGAHSKVSMNTGIVDAFSSVGSRLGYVYDFGSSTELVVALSGTVMGSGSTTARVVARNEAINWPCGVCGRPATAMCAQCAYEGTGFCCAAHAQTHECG